MLQNPIFLLCRASSRAMSHRKPSVLIMSAQCLQALPRALSGTCQRPDEILGVEMMDLHSPRLIRSNYTFVGGTWVSHSLQ